MLQINNDILENAYETQKQWKRKYYIKGNAEGIERVLYICPKCHKIGTISSKGDSFSCTCGMSAKLDEYGFFTGDGIDFKSIDKWNEWQIGYLSGLMQDKDFTLWDDDQKLYILDKDHSLTLKAEGRLTMTCDSLLFNEEVYPLDKIQFSIIRKQDIVFSYGGVNYEVHSEKTRSAYKYITMFNILNAQRQRKDKMVK